MLDRLLSLAAGEFVCFFARSLYPSSIPSQSFLLQSGLGEKLERDITIGFMDPGKRRASPLFCSNIGDGGELMGNSDDVCNQSCRIAGWRDAGTRLRKGARANGVTDVSSPIQQKRAHLAVRSKGGREGGTLEEEEEEERA